jgi:Amt family ammonium transporter
VFPWAALLMGILSGSVPWYTMMVLHRKSAFFHTRGLPHTCCGWHLGGILSGIFAKPNLLTLMYRQKYGPGLIYSFSDGEVGKGLRQIGYQLAGAAFVTAWNAGMTSLICILISRIVSLRMNEDDLESGDDAAHGEEAYALWGDGDNMPTSRRWLISPRIPICCRNV